MMGAGMRNELAEVRRMANGGHGMGDAPKRPDDPDFSVLPGDARTTAEIRAAVDALTAEIDLVVAGYLKGYADALNDLLDRLELDQ